MGLGNKWDVDDEGSRWESRAIHASRGKQLADELDCPFYEMSVKRDTYLELDHYVNPSKLSLLIGGYIRLNIGTFNHYESSLSSCISSYMPDFASFNSVWGIAGIFHEITRAIIRCAQQDENRRRQAPTN